MSAFVQVGATHDLTTYPKSWVDRDLFMLVTPADQVLPPDTIECLGGALAR